MNRLNPYASYLGEREPLSVLAETAPRLAVFARTLTVDQLNQAPAPGKWSIREILCHLADTETVFAFRLRQTLAEPGHTVQPFDQGTWAERYAAYDATAALEMFAAMRGWNLKLLAGVAPEEKSKQVTHPQRGTMTFWTIVETMAGHDVNHLKQVEAIVGGLSI